MVWGQGRGLKRWNTGNSQGSKTTVYDAVMVDMWNYALGKTHTTVQQSEPNVNYEGFS